jgi:hypothetical protein
MRSHTKYLTMNVSVRMDFVNITDEVTAAVAESRVREGLCLVNAMHITASVFINDDEPGCTRLQAFSHNSGITHLAPLSGWPAAWRGCSSSAIGPRELPLSTKPPNGEPLRRVNSR